MKDAHGQRGSTLMSVMIALSILALGLISVARIQVSLVATQSGAMSRSTALAIARGHLEWVRSRDPQTIASEAPQPVNEQGQPAADGVYQRSVEVVEVRPNLLLVRVLVTYPRGPQPVELVTMAYRGPA